MATIRLSPVLRAQADGARTVDVAGGTLRDGLDDLLARFPGLRPSLMDDDGQINRFVNVYVDQEDVKLRDGLDTALRDDSTVILMPAMAGGRA
jgi:molybdopterin synthase sulfur carrier subunit